MLTADKRVLRGFGQDACNLTRKNNYINHVVTMNNRIALHPPAKRDETLHEKQSLDDAMQQWLKEAQSSDDVRNRIAVSEGISRGVFGSLHFSCSAHREAVDSAVDGDGESFTEDLKHAA